MRTVKEFLSDCLDFMVAIYDEEKEVGEVLPIEDAIEKYGNYTLCSFNAHDEKTICINIFE